MLSMKLFASAFYATENKRALRNINNIIDKQRKCVNEQVTLISWGRYWRRSVRVEVEVR